MVFSERLSLTFTLVSNCNDQKRLGFGPDVIPAGCQLPCYGHNTGQTWLPTPLSWPAPESSTIHHPHHPLYSALKLMPQFYSTFCWACFCFCSAFASSYEQTITTPPQQQHQLQQQEQQLQQQEQQLQQASTLHNSRRINQPTFYVPHDQPHDHVIYPLLRHPYPYPYPYYL